MVNNLWIFPYVYTYISFSRHQLKKFNCWTLKNQNIMHVVKLSKFRTKLWRCAYCDVYVVHVDWVVQIYNQFMMLCILCMLCKLSIFEINFRCCACCDVMICAYCAHCNVFAVRVVQIYNQFVMVCMLFKLSKIKTNLWWCVYCYYCKRCQNLKPSFDVVQIVFP